MKSRLQQLADGWRQQVLEMEQDSEGPHKSRETRELLLACADELEEAMQLPTVPTTLESLLWGLRYDVGTREHSQQEIEDRLDQVLQMFGPIQVTWGPKTLIEGQRVIVREADGSCWSAITEDEKRALEDGGVLGVFSVVKAKALVDTPISVDIDVSPWTAFTENELVWSTTPRVDAGDKSPFVDLACKCKSLLGGHEPGCPEARQ